MSDCVVDTGPGALHAEARLHEDSKAQGVRPKLLFVGAFPPPGHPTVGGNVSDCAALLGSSLQRRVELILLDSTEEPGRRTFMQRLSRAMRRAAKFVVLVRRERPTAVLLLASYGFGYVEKSLLAAYARAVGVPAMLSIRSGHFIDQCRGSAAFRLLASILLKAPTLLVAQGARWQEFFSSTFGIPAERCPVVEPWVATEEVLEVGRTRVNRVSSPVVLLFLGALERSKGIFELVEAFARVRADPGVPDAVLVLGGGGSLSGELRALVESRRLSGAVRFGGVLTGAVKLQHFREADLFVLPSYTEGLPNAMIEAMAAGLPVLVTPVGSIPDVIVHGSNGWLVSPRDAAALEVGLRRLMKDSALRARLGAEAHRLAAIRYTPEGAAERLEQLTRDSLPGAGIANRDQ